MRPVNASVFARLCPKSPPPYRGGVRGGMRRSKIWPLSQPLPGGERSFETKPSEDGIRWLLGGLRRAREIGIAQPHLRHGKEARSCSSQERSREMSESCALRRPS